MTDKARRAFLRRERFSKKVLGEYVSFFIVRGEHVPETRDADVRTDMGSLRGETGMPVAWHEVPLPPCPDCGGDLVWWEAGFVPGTRKCLGKPSGLAGDGRPLYDIEGGCGSLFHVETEEG